MGRTVTRRSLLATPCADGALLSRQVGLPERRLLGDEHQGQVVARPVAVLGDDELGLPSVDLTVVHPLAVEEEDDVGVLLDRAAVAEVAELRALVLALLGGPGELRQRG